MEPQTVTKNLSPGVLVPLFPLRNEIDAVSGKSLEEWKNFFQHIGLPWLEDVLKKMAIPAGKKSFLVMKNKKYINVLTKNIAFFYIKYESAMIMSFEKEEYFVNYSLEQLQNFLPENQFFRLNRQYLINFMAVKDVEPFFARKLLVNTVLPVKDKIIVSKERVSEFLHWLDNR